MSQPVRNCALPTGSNCSEQVAGSAATTNGRRGLGVRQGGVGEGGDQVEARHERRSGHERAQRHHPLCARPGPTASRTARRAAPRRSPPPARLQVHQRRLDVDHLLDEHLGVEEGAVPQRPLGDHHGEQRDQHPPQVGRVARTPRATARPSDPPSPSAARTPGSRRALSRTHSEIASSPAEARNGRRHPQAANAASPTVARAASVTSSAAQSPTAAEVWIQLVAKPRPPPGRRARPRRSPPAVLAAQRHALRHPQEHEQKRRDDAQRRRDGGQLRIAGQEADAERRPAHQADGDEEGATCGRADRRCGRTPTHPPGGRRSRPRRSPGRRGRPPSRSDRRRTAWR